MYRISKGVKFSEERKKKLSKSGKEKYIKGYISPTNRKVYKYDNDDNIINVYPSVTKASKAEGYSREAICKWCNNIRKPRNDYTWSYIEKVDTINNKELNLN